jgi:hypothetical protein
MTDDTLLPFDLPSVCRKKIIVDFNGGTADKGCVPAGWQDAVMCAFQVASRLMAIVLAA